MLFIGITALAVLIQAIVLAGIYFTVRKAVQTSKDEADAYRAKLTPIIDTGSQMLDMARELILSTKTFVTSTKTFVENLQPELQSAASELSSMVRDIHSQANQLQASVDDVALKARNQVDRVDTMATSLLNNLDRFGHFVNDAVRMPIRQMNGIVAAARAIVDTLRAPAQANPRSRPSTDPVHAAEDKDLFV